MAGFGQHLCRILALALLLSTAVSAQFEHYLDSLRANELYEFNEGTGHIQYLPKGDSEQSLLQLQSPINFYGEKYDQLYINTNGILTFNVEFAEYLNQPFPLEYPSIAPFYSNVDTSDSDENSSITLFETNDSGALYKAQQLIRYAFSEEQDFEARQLIVATWRNVGYFDSKTDRVNTFQVALIVNEEQTFVQFIYPEGGLNWLQGEAGSLGLPDIRAQAGFVAEDGRYFNLNGSGSENARFLSESTNLGVPGVWLYAAGPLAEGENVRIPDNAETRTESPALAQTCNANSHQCDTHAQCHDKAEGYCCVCQPGYYGNGRACIANDVPIRVTGSLEGDLNGVPVDERAKLQSYVVTSDARSYTAVNPVSTELGAQLRLVLPLLTTIGWLFAKPVGGAVNGYQLTGGHYVHTSRIQYDSGEVLLVNQTFEGLNYWDQLDVKITLHGSVPQVSHSEPLHLADYTDEYRFVRPGELHSEYSHQLELSQEQRVIGCQVEQTIIYQSCLRDDDADPTDTSVLQKVSKIVLDYSERDQALRTSAVNKIGVDAESNACTDGSAQCGENAVCVPYDDTYRCDCRHGFGPQLDERGAEICLDIDECASGTHVCDDNALCTNNEGGFTCICYDGYEGNGYRCLRNNTADNIEYSTPAPLPPTYEGDSAEVPNGNVDYPPQQQYECHRCAPDADCYEGRCICRSGFSGNGYSCVNICGHDEVWEHGRCVPLLLDEHELEANCNEEGDCNCPEGYELTEDSRTCRYILHYPVEPSEDLVPCDVDANCHINATCAWYEQELRHICTCNPGLSGDGYNCDPIDDSCAMRPDICDPHASCQYQEQLDKSECVCERGYRGDGFHCQLEPECQWSADCGDSAFCDNGVCQCNEGLERDANDLCVQSGRCGAVFCGSNAICKWDASQGVQYCACLDGYEGDALEGCTSKPEPCNVRNTCGIHATCEPTEDPAHYECQCNAGYHGDGYVCIEELNCLNKPTLCDMNAKCHSTNTGLVCVCNQGFYGNGSVCFERQQHESDFLIVSQGVMIVRVPLNGRNVLPISVTSMAIGLDKDCVEGRIYWGDISTKKIMSSKYDGTDARPFITTDIESPEGIAIDVVSRRLYWTDSVKDTIEVASLDDPTLRAVIINKQLVNPRGIAVDPIREKIYWSDWDRAGPKIEFSDLDGTGREILLGKDAVNLPNSLVVLESSGELCFADAGTKKVECIDAHSHQIRTISNDLSYPFGLTFTHDQFYWTDWTTKKLESVNNQGERQKSIQTPFFGSHKMYGMTSVEQNCPQFESPCQINNGGCTDARLCLVNRKAPSGKSCKCTSASTSCNVPTPYAFANAGPRM
ncbi:nidogen-1 [Scaptodrosophila lebanonensis]|uniref:Nidogen-1 n=1 Tax=Drosophila lebanonensis TaxID=7225 RepID=A0A6J2UK08_DROLE|nr:nidogen-1 [Scaptodrosophila lebanonensis]